MVTGDAHKRFPTASFHNNIFDCFDMQEGCVFEGDMGKENTRPRIRCEPLGEHFIHWTSAVFSHIALFGAPSLTLFVLYMRKSISTELLRPLSTTLPW